MALSPGTRLGHDDATCRRRPQRLPGASTARVSANNHQSVGRPESAEHETEGRRYRGAARLGVILMGLSLALWVLLLLVPFLPISAPGKAGFAGTQIIVAEIAFWGGAALAGPTAARRMKSWWRSTRADEAN